MSALSDITIVLEWLAATKTPTNRVAAALERLNNLQKLDRDLENMEPTPSGDIPADDYEGKDSS